MALFALSYDEPDALAAYADEFEVTFPLLSDPDSEIIERFGILNTLVEPDDHPWHGIPFPGSYVADADGVVIAKFFEENLGLRANADQLRRAAMGDDVEVVAVEPPESVTVDVALDGESLAPGVLRDLVITLRVPPGQHLYGEPVPEAMVATGVVVDDDVSTIVRPSRLPPTRPHVLAGTGETLHVFDGDVVIRVPVSHTGRGLGKADDGSPQVHVTGTVRWQSCDDHSCHLPASHRFELTVPATPFNTPDFARAEPETRMDFRSHFLRMVARRSVED